MYLGELGQCISVAHLWWDGNRFQRMAIMKRRQGDGWAVRRLSLGDLYIVADLGADWISVWVGDYADMRAQVTDILVSVIMEELASVTQKDISAGQQSSDLDS